MNDSATLTGLIFLGRTLQFGSGMLLVSVAVFRWLIVPHAALGAAGESAELRRFLRRLDAIFIASAFTLVLSGVLLFLGAAAGMSGTPLAGVFDPTLLSTVLRQTEYGRICQARGVIALLLTGAAAGLFFPPARPALRMMSALLAGALFISVALTGHAAAVSHAGAPWLLLFDMTHLATTAIWPAGLLPFALFLGCMKNSHSAHGDLILKTVRRFSAVSLAAVGALALTGLANAWFLGGSFSRLLGSTYGHVLGLKLLVFALMLGVAAWNRQVLLPRLFAQAERGDPEATALTGLILRRFVLAEVALAALVIVIVSVLGVTPPPALPS
jgi:putative copper resistance protein D